MNLEVIANKFCYWAEQPLEKLAAAKKKTKKKLDPKAKVRNRGTVCVPASSAKDKKDHFPINNIDQARNALARVHQYSAAPSWYKGSLKGLQSLVSRKVHSKYPAIGKSEKKSKKTKKKSDLMSSIMAFGQQVAGKSRAPANFQTVLNQFKSIATTALASTNKLLSMPKYQHSAGLKTFQQQLPEIITSVSALNPNDSSTFESVKNVLNGLSYFSNPSNAGTGYDPTTMVKEHGISGPGNYMANLMSLIENLETTLEF